LLVEEVVDTSMDVVVVLAVLFMLQVFRLKQV